MGEAAHRQFAEYPLQPQIQMNTLYLERSRDAVDGCHRTSARDSLSRQR